MNARMKKATAAAIVVIPSVAWAALCAATGIDPTISFLGGYVVGSASMLGAIAHWYKV